MITVVYSGPIGFVTDMGEPTELRSLDGSIYLTLPRYGVWKPRARGEKFEVTHTCADLDEAKRVCDDGRGVDDGN